MRRSGEMRSDGTRRSGQSVPPPKRPEQRKRQRLQTWALRQTGRRADIVTRGAAGRVVGWRGGREGGRWGRQRGWRRLGSVRLPVAVIAAKVSELVLALPEFTSSDLLQCFRFLVHVLVEGQAPSLCIPDTLWAGVGGILKAVD